MTAHGEKKLTDEQHKLLKIHADHFYHMVSYVRECDAGELQELQEAADAHGVTNCSYWAYAAAQFIKNEIRSLIAVRKKLADCQTEK